MLPLYCLIPHQVPSSAGVNYAFRSGVDDYDLDSDGENDFCIYDGEEPNNKIPAKASIASLNLTEGTSGNIVRHTTYKRVWQEDRDYLYPIPTDDIELTFGAIKQNPGWNDGMN